MTTATTEEIKVVFEQTGDFQALCAAEHWCCARGISFGSCQGDDPRGLLHGDVDIAKWRNLSVQERMELDGTMTGDMRNGPVTISIKGVAA